MSSIETIIDEILKEPIAHYLGDSGEAYGYRYERNQKEGYLKGLNPVEEYTNEESKKRTLEITIPVYDFLTYNLTRDSDAVCKEQHLFLKLKERDIDPGSIYEVEEVLKGTFENGLFDIKYINTYNFEEYLSQTLLFCPFRSDGEDYIILEVHNGCDVRSGYTKPKVFKVNDIEYFWSGLSDRECECDCGLNDYTIYGSDDATDSMGNYVYKDEIYKRTYLDTKGNVRCRNCDSVIKGGFVEW